MIDRRRRHWLKLGTRTLCGAGLALGSHPLAALAAANGSQPLDDASGDYRALVCVFLDGGMDGFSLAVPTGGPEYAAYRRSRGTLALDAAKLLSLTGDGTEQGSLGLHAAAAPLRSLYDDGRLALIANVGNLVEPTSRAQYLDRAVKLPAQLFSHADQAVQWQQLQGRNRARDGWGALAADHLMNAANAEHLGSISLTGSNAWQSGAGRRPFSLRESGVASYAGLSSDSDWEHPRREAFEAVLAAPQRHLLTQAYAELQHRARTNTTALGAALAARFGDDPAAQPIAHDPESETLAARLNMVAKVMALHPELGMRRQIFYVRMRGYDVHDNQNSEMPVLFDELSRALAGFQQALGSLGLADQVTTFTASDFGRSLSANGDGTDHGWGNHLFAMGGAVRGGKVYGTLPELDVDGADAVNNGRVLPTLSAVEYAATLLRWVGLEQNAVQQVLPTWSNFGRRDVGFMT